MRDIVARVESFIITIPRDTPYLGALRAGEEANARGYFVRKGNRTVYPTVDRNVLVRITTDDGVGGNVVTTIPCIGLLVLEFQTLKFCKLVEVKGTATLEYVASGPQ